MASWNEPLGYTSSFRPVRRPMRLIYECEQTSKQRSKRHCKKPRKRSSNNSPNCDQSFTMGLRPKVHKTRKKNITKASNFSRSMGQEEPEVNITPRKTDSRSHSHSRPTSQEVIKTETDARRITRGFPVIPSDHSSECDQTERRPRGRPPSRIQQRTPEQRSGPPKFQEELIHTQERRPRGRPPSRNQQRIPSEQRSKSSELQESANTQGRRPRGRPPSRNQHYTPSKKRRRPSELQEDADTQERRPRGRPPSRNQHYTPSELQEDAVTQERRPRGRPPSRIQQRITFEQRRPELKDDTVTQERRPRGRPPSRIQQRITFEQRRPELKDDTGAQERRPRGRPPSRNQHYTSFELQEDAGTQERRPRGRPPSRNQHYTPFELQEDADTQERRPRGRPPSRNQHYTPFELQEDAVTQERRPRGRPPSRNQHYTPFELQEDAVIQERRPRGRPPLIPPSRINFEQSSRPFELQEDVDTQVRRPRGRPPSRNQQRMEVTRIEQRSRPSDLQDDADTQEADSRRIYRSYQIEQPRRSVRIANIQARNSGRNKHPVNRRKGNISSSTRGRTRAPKKRSNPSDNSTPDNPESSDAKKINWDRYVHCIEFPPLQTMTPDLEVQENEDEGREDCKPPPSPNQQVLPPSGHSDPGGSKMEVEWADPKYEESQVYDSIPYRPTLPSHTESYEPQPKYARETDRTPQNTSSSIFPPQALPGRPTDHRGKTSPAAHNHSVPNYGNNHHTNSPSMNTPIHCPPIMHNIRPEYRDPYDRGNGGWGEPKLPPLMNNHYDSNHYYNRESSSAYYPVMHPPPLFNRPLDNRRTGETYDSRTNSNWTEGRTPPLAHSQSVPYPPILLNIRPEYRDSYDRGSGGWGEPRPLMNNHYQPPPNYYYNRETDEGRHWINTSSNYYNPTVANGPIDYRRTVDRFDAPGCSSWTYPTVRTPSSVNSCSEQESYNIQQNNKIQEYENVQKYDDVQESDNPQESDNAQKYDDVRESDNIQEVVADKCDSPATDDSSESEDLGMSFPMRVNEANIPPAWVFPYPFLMEGGNCRNNLYENMWDEGYSGCHQQYSSLLQNQGDNGNTSSDCRQDSSGVSIVEINNTPQTNSENESETAPQSIRFGRMLARVNGMSPDLAEVISNILSKLNVTELSPEIAEVISRMLEGVDKSAITAEIISILAQIIFEGQEKGTTILNLSIQDGLISVIKQVTCPDGSTIRCKQDISYAVQRIN